MGANASSEEIQTVAEELKREVQNFRGDMSSKQYKRLHKKLIKASAHVSASKSITPQRRDQLLFDLNEYLKGLTEKVCNYHNNAFKNRLFERGPVLPIECYETEVNEIEDEVNEVNENNDYYERKIVEGKIKIFLANLRMIKSEGTFSSSRQRNEIRRRLEACLEKVRSSGSPTSLSHQFSFSSTSIKTSTETISSKLQDLRFSQSDGYKWEGDYKETPPRYHETFQNKSDEPPPLPPKPKIKSQPLVPQKLSKPFKPNYAHMELGEAPAFNKYPGNDLHEEIAQTRMNFIRGKLLELQGKISLFNGKYKDIEYVKIESALLGYKKQLGAVDSQGYDLISTSKEHYVKYVDSLLQYLFNNASRNLPSTSRAEINITNRPPVPEKPQTLRKSQINMNEKIFNNSMSRKLEKKEHMHVYDKKELQERFFSEALGRIIYPPVVKYDNGNSEKRQTSNTGKIEADPTSAQAGGVSEADHSQIEATIRTLNDNVKPRLLMRELSCQNKKPGVLYRNKMKSISDINEELRQHFQKGKQNQKEECSDDSSS